jgi:hypothetical protein
MKWYGKSCGYTTTTEHASSYFETGQPRPRSI